MSYNATTVNGAVINNATSVQLNSLQNSHNNYAILEIAFPNLARKTIILGQNYGGDDFNGTLKAIQGDSTAFDSANFIAASGTMTGSVSVFGYNA